MAGAAASATTRVRDGANTHLNVRVIDASAGSVPRVPAWRLSLLLGDVNEAWPIGEQRPADEPTRGGTIGLSWIRGPNVEYRSLE
jgi:hypothetical protein